MKRIALWLAKLYLWATHRLYNEFAWAYDLVSWLVSFGQWDRWRKTALDHAVGQRVLEVGFGTGELLIEMARRGMHVCGIDLSPAMHRVTARKMAHRGIQAPRVRALVQRAPFADGSFVTIVATFPAEYVASPATLRKPHDPQAPIGEVANCRCFTIPVWTSAQKKANRERRSRRAA